MRGCLGMSPKSKDKTGNQQSGKPPKKTAPGRLASAFDWRALEKPVQPGRSVSTDGASPSTSDSAGRHKVRQVAPLGQDQLQRAVGRLQFIMIPEAACEPDAPSTRTIES